MMKSNPNEHTNFETARIRVHHCRDTQHNTAQNTVLIYLPL